MRKYFGIIALASVLASCTKDGVQDVYPDGIDEIRISVGHGISTRAAEVYRAWSATTDPTTMGVIAFTNGTPNPYIYNNVEFTAPTKGTVWTTAQKAYWRNYGDATALDFFACMPYVAGTTVTQSSNTYTLTLTDVPGASDKPYLVATTPVHYASAFGNVTPVQFQMDQLMTAFEFQFALGADMGGLRTFRITSVQMSHITTSATVTQAYTFTDGAWAKGTTTIHGASDHHAEARVTSTEGIKIGYNNSSEYVTFPGMLYTIPYDLTTVVPKIDVTYDVYDQDGYKTRTATNEIELNDTNFGTIGTVQSAHKNIIKIKIVPTKLHILSDADQSTSGYLIVG